MATLTGVNTTQYANAFVTKPSVKNDVSLEKGRVRRAYAEYTVDAADEFGTSGLINFFKLPKGARLIDASLIIPSAGGAGIVDIGWDGGADSLETADPNGIFVGADPGAAAVNADLDKTVAGYNHKFLDTVIIQGDISEATTDSGGDSWELEILYVLD